mmetsp:Transcript_3363/g.8303  ORF Transcript_3363/g.8303 Transcript_3363/m.8303 type:complete len:216 (-) Transcript_3363:1256-1903(-)
MGEVFGNLALTYFGVECIYSLSDIVQFTLVRQIVLRNTRLDERVDRVDNVGVLRGDVAGGRRLLCRRRVGWRRGCAVATLSMSRGRATGRGTACRRPARSCGWGHGIGRRPALAWWRPSPPSHGRRGGSRKCHCLRWWCRPTTEGVRDCRRDVYVCLFLTQAVRVHFWRLSPLLAGAVCAAGVCARTRRAAAAVAGGRNRRRPLHWSGCWGCWVP